MNLTISGHGLDVTPALRSHVSGKLERLWRRFDQVTDVRVRLSIDNHKDKNRRQRAECNIRVKGADLYAESASQDMYAAVDELVDKLDRQIVRHKGKLKEHDATAVRDLM